MRRYLLWGALIVACGGLAWQLTRSDASLSWPLFDFVEYWTAGRLTLQGDNPYDTRLVRETQLEADPQAAGVEMWNPPWTLAVVLPFGAMPPRLAHILWLILQLAALVWSADAAWRFYGGSSEKRWIAWAVAFTFAPTFIALTAGQISPLLLLGAVLFLRCERGGLAGAVAALLAIKPHLTYLFWMALLLWAVERRRWMVLAGGVAAGVLATALPLFFNPDVLEQYWHTVTSEPPARYDSPTLGMALRLMFGRDLFGLQFVPMIPGLIWLILYWRRHRRSWHWGHQLPMILLVSMFTAPYGAWPFDLVLLLVPVLHRAACFGSLRRTAGASSPWDGLPSPSGKEPDGLGSPSHSRFVPAVRLTDKRAIAAICLYAAAQVAAAVLILCGFAYFRFIWMTPALLLAYLLASTEASRAP